MSAYAPDPPTRPERHACTHARRVRPHAYGLALALVLVLFAGSVALGAGRGPTAGGAGASAPRSVRTLADAELRTEITAVEATVEALGTELLAADEARDSVARQRDRALVLLQEWLATAYRDGDVRSQLIIDAVANGSVAHTVDRVRVVREIGEYRARVVRTLRSATATYDAQTLERARLIARLTQAQERDVALRGEESRRLGVRVKAARAKAARAAARSRAAAARRAAKVGAPLAGIGGGAPGALVGLGTPLSPSVFALAAGGTTGGASAGVLDAYLMSKGSPMAGQGAAFVASGARWRVDPRLLVAIAGAESNFGAITCGPHNAWGWACPNSPEAFATWAAGIDTVTAGLRRGYLDEGRTSVALIQQKYAPSRAANDPTGLNDNWVGNVSKFLMELGGSPAMVGPGPLGGPALPDLGGLGLLGDS